MEGAAVPPPANPDQNPNGNANQPDQDDEPLEDNNAPTEYTGYYGRCCCATPCKSISEP